ncbi:MAG TPA: EF-P lysine aminoacylase EpmA [Alphaproteobacteria bacterium]|nr:EF-P lysine aminoacylase EpmA [Alphaproteobacteria bacterium]
MRGKAWWRRDALERRRRALAQRGAALAALRAFFASRGFAEVETPALQVSPGLDLHVRALGVELADPLGARRRLYLHTSPEFAMKKLLAGGIERIFQIARVWRDGERSPLHHPEFTLVEWYRAGATYDALMEDCAALLAELARAAGVEQLVRGTRACDPLAAPIRLSVADAFARFCGIDLLATAPDPARPDRVLLAAEARRIGLYVSDNDTWEDVFHRIMLERIEPKLGDGAATFLCDYPLALASLARPSARDPRIAERVELYACGVELANGFSELRDPVEQRARFERDAAERKRLYGVDYPIDEDFLAALSEMPEAAGIALGFDRLVMLLTGAETIEDVLWAPVAE